MTWPTQKPLSQPQPAAARDGGQSTSMRLLIILAAFGFLIAALHAPNPEPVKALCAVFAAVIIISNLQEL